MCWTRNRLVDGCWSSGSRTLRLEWSCSKRRQRQVRAVSKRFRSRLDLHSAQWRTRPEESWLNGWLRILGAGSSQFTRTLSSWNRKGAGARISGAFLVGDDAVGGFFALNGGRFGQTSNVFSFAPDDLEWQDLEVGYSDWLQWAFSGSVDSFYEGLRWASWRDDIGGGPYDQRERRPVAVEEIWSLYVERLAALIF